MGKKYIASLLFIAFTALAFTAQADTTIEIEGTDTLQFSKESITVKPGEEVTIKLTNNTDMPANAMSHNFLLLEQDADAEAVDEAAQGAKDNDYIPEDMDDQIIAHTGLVAGGESDSVTFTAPEETGDYEYICTFPGHFAAGMKGTLTVEE